jgi:hypothetical protein
MSKVFKTIKTMEYFAYCDVTKYWQPTCFLFNLKKIKNKALELIHLGEMIVRSTDETGCKYLIGGRPSFKAEKVISEWEQLLRARLNYMDKVYLKTREYPKENEIPEHIGIPSSFYEEYDINLSGFSINDLYSHLKMLKKLPTNGDDIAIKHITIIFNE